MDVTGKFTTNKDRLTGVKSHNYTINARAKFNKNIAAGGSLSGNTLHEPTSSAFVSIEKSHNCATLSHRNDPGYGTTKSTAASANLLNNNGQVMNANAFISQTKLENGFKFNTHGAGISYKNPTGTSVAAGMSKIPGFQTTTEISASQNIFKAPNVSLDVNASATRTCNTFGQCNKNGIGSFSFQGKF